MRETKRERKLRVRGNGMRDRGEGRHGLEKRWFAKESLVGIIKLFQ